MSLIVQKASLELLAVRLAKGLEVKNINLIGNDCYVELRMHPPNNDYNTKEGKSQGMHIPMRNHTYGSYTNGNLRLGGENGGGFNFPISSDEMKNSHLYKDFNKIDIPLKNGNLVCIGNG